MQESSIGLLALRPQNGVFIYDADGRLLLQQAPGHTTLYIFGEQLDLNFSSRCSITAAFQSS